MPAAFAGLTEAEDEPRKPSLGNRRQTILSLVEMLLSQNEDTGQGATPGGQQPLFEDDKDVPTVDEHLQKVGAETFNKFQKRINLLDKELRNFANAARQLGSSAAILSSAFHLRQRLAQILYIYQDNASDLFPRKITKPTSQAPEVKTKGRRVLPRMGKMKVPALMTRPIIPEKDLNVECFPEQFEALARDVTNFVRCLNEFPEFTDDAVNISVQSFEGDLKYWASCLKEYEGQFRYPAVQRYIHDLASEMGEHIDSITSTLIMFIEIGVPTIRFAQKHGATNLLNLSTVATFFSAVTATTLQFSFEDNHNVAAVAVNTFWFASLVFSIAAAVNSLLGLTWKQAMYRSPGHRVPWWVLIWMKRSPLVFLVISVACFSVGLVCFTWATQQDVVTRMVTTVFTACTSFGLAAVSAWFAFERWTFVRHQGKIWLSDVLVELGSRFFSLPGMAQLKASVEYIGDAIGRHLSTAHKHALRMSQKTVSLLSLNSTSGNDEEKVGDMELPTTATNGNGNDVNHERDPSSSTRPRDSDATAIPSPEPTSPVSMTSVAEGSEAASNPASPTVTQPSIGKQLWKNAIRTVRMRTAVSNNLAALAGIPRSPHRQRTVSSTLASDLGGRKRTMMDELPVPRSRVATLVPKLKILSTTQDLPAHQALVRHLQFSPDGKFLATSSWDRTSVIFRVGEPFESHRILAHAKGFVGQVAWSPSGNLLLTKFVRGIKVWTEDGVCSKTIDRPAYVESVTWMPGGEAFLSVEGSNVTKLDIKGKELGSYNFGTMKLHDVAVTPDRTRLLGVGPLLASPTGLQPSKANRGEKRLVVYNMHTDQIEHQTPVLNDVRDITLARNERNGLVALVSYENKAPPQLWKLELVKDVARLTLRHTYMPKVPVDFAGPSYFGGKNDELVLCAGKAGDIHIWDQESGALLHHVRAQDLGGDLTCIAWNHAAEDPFMFATGSHDGAIRIWTRPSYHDEAEGAVRTASPFEMEDIERTDSPIPQPDYVSTFTQDSSQTESGPSMRDRTVSFATEHPPDIT